MYAFAGLIAAGTLLLLAPFAHHGGGSTPFMEALFTATSAVTVTGLVIQDTATYWTRYGQVIILALMFIGGLGFLPAVVLGPPKPTIKKSLNKKFSGRLRPPNIGSDLGI